MNLPDFDIAIAGCGIAGSMAAVTAARRGRRVLAIDEAGYPGGALTAMGTGPMMTFHAGKTQVVRGLPQELIDRLMARGFSPGHTVDSTGYTYTVTPFSAEGMKRILEEMMLEAGVTLLYHTVVTGAEVQSGELKRILCFSCGETFSVSASVFIDATGDGDLLTASGVPVTSGRLSDGKSQPMTMNFKIDGVDTAAIRSIMETQPELFPFLAGKPGIGNRDNFPSQPFQQLPAVIQQGLVAGITDSGEKACDFSSAFFHEHSPFSAVLFCTSSISSG